jgi:hypothetical protein
LTTKTFQHQTQLMARLPGVQITASANLPTTTDGAVPLVIKSKHKPIAVTVGGEAQANAAHHCLLTLNDPLWSGSQLQASAMLQNPTRSVSAASVSPAANARGHAGTCQLFRLPQLQPAGNAHSGGDDLTQQRKLDFNISHLDLEQYHPAQHHGRSVCHQLQP